LAIVKGLIELHSGKVSAMSAGLGKGSITTVELPINTQILDETPAASNHSTHEAVGPFKVLVIDDRRDASYPVVMFLEKYGHRVVTAFDGLTGVAEAFSHVPVIVDLRYWSSRLLWLRSGPTVTR
jgi:PleD family two-component response regulator